MPEQTISADATVSLPTEMRNVNNNILFINVDNSGGAITLTLPPIADVLAAVGKDVKIIVNDFTGNATANNIDVDSDAADTINSVASVGLVVNGEAMEIIIAEDNQWKAVISA